MKKYYTRACNFFYGEISKQKIKNKLSLPLNGDEDISFDEIEIISNNFKKKIKISKIKYLNIKLKNQIKVHLNNITKKKKFKNLNLSKKPILMGILNITPDSFSDGGKYLETNKALKQCKELINSGCEIIDIGGESTRPGSVEINDEEEWGRIENVLRNVSKLKSNISLDSRKVSVMRKASKFRINLINDISGLNYSKDTINFLKSTNLPFVIHHIQGNPQTMQKNPKYKNVLIDIYDYFELKIKMIRSAGIKHNNILLDPGIGFGKNLKHNMNILKNISIFHSLGYPILVGISKKKFIGEISKNYDSKKRYGGTISTSMFLAMQGVQILRVHEAREINQALTVFKKLRF